MLITDWNKLLAWLTGPIIAIAVTVWMMGLGLAWPAIATGAITAWVAFWWMMEPIPIPATSLIPIALFPLLGVLSPTEVATAYGNPMILLMLGGFLLSRGIEHSGVHRRLALTMVRSIGRGGERGVVWGFLVTSAVMSMWISNAATCLMLLPIATAVIMQSEHASFRRNVLLAVAYGASLGGINTPIGTPPNLIFLENYRELTGAEIGFLQWTGWVWPIGVGMLLFTAFWLVRNVSTSSPLQLPAVGQWTSHERRALLIFGLTAMLWITRTQPWGGWSEWTGLESANDSNVALIGALLMFVTPSGKGEGEPVLTWEAASRIPWGILLLFAGGITIAKAFMESGLSEILGNQLAALSSLPVWALVLIICLAVTFLTEVTSNTATATILMPILAAASASSGLDPLTLMIPATISASFAFMLPVATPPNAIVFGASEISVRDMANNGLVLNLLGAAWIALVTLFWIG